MQGPSKALTQEGISKMIKTLKRLRNVTAPEHIDIPAQPGVVFQRSRQCKAQRKPGSIEANLRVLYISDPSAASDSDTGSPTGADAVLRWFAEQGDM